jgi:predicted outer membrane repeat protein
MDIALSNIHFDNALFINNRASLDGGAITSSKSNLNGDYHMINNHVGRFGGAVYGVLNTIIRPSWGSVSVWINNEAASGGALYLESSDIDSTSSQFFFQNNTATNGDGGAVLCSRCWFSPPPFNASHNRAINGRGGFIAAFEPSWFEISIGTFVRDCISDGDGGAVYLVPQPDLQDNSVTASFVNCSSRGGGGGAIFIGATSLMVMTSCTFNNNNAVYGHDIASIATTLQLRSRSIIRTSYSPAQLIDPITIELKDLFNQTVSTDSMTVIAVGLKSGILSGSSLQRLTKGIANFTDLRIIGDVGLHIITWNAMNTLSVELIVNNTGICYIGTMYSINSGISLLLYLMCSLDYIDYMYNRSMYGMCIWQVYK